MNKVLSKPSDPRVIIIAGVTGGIGSALARQLWSQGCLVAGFARHQDRLDALTEECPGMELSTLDGCDSSGVEAFAAAVEARHGRIDGYAHCIGSLLLKPAHITRDEEWFQTLNVNLSTSFYGLRAVVKVMQKHGKGSIVMTSSVAAKMGLSNHEAIAAAKAGVEGLVRAAAATYAPRGVRINAVAPGLVETPLTERLLSNEQVRKVSEKMHPLGFIGRPSDVAGLMSWLLTDESAWVTGQVWSCDGGMADLRAR